MADLRVTWVELLTAALYLEGTAAEARALPQNVGAAFDQLDMTASPAGWATADFLSAWHQGLTALADASEGVGTWLMRTSDTYRELDAELARRAGS